jgi:zinc/manganese transport system permease protein
VTAFSWNILADLQEIFQYQFMRNAFAAGTIIAVVAGLVSYFVVLRRSSFAAHALGHIGFAGAAGAVLLAVNPFVGLLVATMGSGAGIAVLGKRAAHRDVEIGAVLAFMLGLGVLFVSQYPGYSNFVISILFGEILGISQDQVLLTLWVSIAVVAALLVVYRPLLFASLDEDVSEAKGMPTLLLGLVFMLLLAVAVSVSIQAVGVLLVFSLLVVPGAIAFRLAKKPIQALAISVLVALFATWLGLFIAWYEPYPVSFFITTIVFGIYLVVRFAVRPYGAARPSVARSLGYAGPAAPVSEPPNGGV